MTSDSDYKVRATAPSHGVPKSAPSLDKKSNRRKRERRRKKPDATIEEAVAQGEADEAHADRKGTDDQHTVNHYA